MAYCVDLRPCYHARAFIQDAPALHWAFLLFLDQPPSSFIALSISSPWDIPVCSEYRRSHSLLAGSTLTERLTLFPLPFGLRPAPFLFPPWLVLFSIMFDSPRYLRVQRGFSSPPLLLFHLASLPSYMVAFIVFPYIHIISIR